MNFNEITKQLLQGKKFYRRLWKQDVNSRYFPDYMYLDFNKREICRVYSCSSHPVVSSISFEELMADDWEPFVSSHSSTSIDESIQNISFTGKACCKIRW